MRIGINLLYLIPHVAGGSQTYATGLLQAFSHLKTEGEFVVFVNEESMHWPLPEGKNFQRVVCPVRAIRRSQRYFFEQFRLPALLRQHQADVVHSLGYVSPLFTPCPAVVSVLDLNYRAFGDQMSRLRRLTLEIFVKWSAERSKAVITISEFSKSQIATLLHIPKKKIFVTLLANLPRFVEPVSETLDSVTKRLKIEPPYILAFSSRSPHKNISRLMEAFKLARRQYALPHQLVLVGHLPESQLVTEAENSQVRAIGYLDNTTLAQVLRHAQLLAFPSYYEGFGLPILEAMGVGVPVVCSNRASLPEVAGEAALFFDPFSVEEMAQKIAQVAGNLNLQALLRQKGFENVKRFSWEQTAQATWAVYEHVYSLA